MSAGGSTATLVYMANQIAAFFVSQPGDKAALQIADHIGAFWDPKMRATIIAYVDQGGDGLVPAAKAAVEVLKSASPKSVERAMAAAGEPSTPHARGDDAG